MSLAMTVPDPLTAMPAPNVAVPPEIVNPAMLPAGPIVTAVPPGAAIVVCAAPPVLTRLTALPWKLRFSGNVPGETETVSPGDAALRAAWIVGNSPGTVSVVEAKAFALITDKIAAARPIARIPQSQRILMLASSRLQHPSRGRLYSQEHKPEGILTDPLCVIHANRRDESAESAIPGMASREAGPGNQGPFGQIDVGTGRGGSVSYGLRWKA